MFTGFSLNFIRIIPDSIFKLISNVSCRSFIVILLICLFCPSHCASISTAKTLPAAASSTQFELMSNSSYRNFVLRQYFIDLLNISHTSLVHSMMYTHHLSDRSIKTRISRRRRVTDATVSSSPLFTVQSSSCVLRDNQAQSTFLWSHSTESLASVELIYHIDSVATKQSIIPLHLKFKHTQTASELLAIDAYLQFDSNRDFYSINVLEHILALHQANLIIESTIASETCQTSHTYMIVSSTSGPARPNQISKLDSALPFDLRQLTETRADSSASACRVRTIQIQFEDLGLAYLIIRPREYTFTYCDGSCSSSSPAAFNEHDQPPLHAILQSIISRKHSNVPAPTCAPTQFADDNFLLRQMDGSMEIYPMKDVIVKQCACL